MHRAGKISAALTPASLRPGGGGSRLMFQGAECPGVLNGSGPDVRCRGLSSNVCPAVTYSPTPSRVQYHRRCGS